VNLCKNVLITKVNDYASAATSAVNSTAVDMTGYDGVLFLTTVAVANAGNYINAAQGAAADGSDAADLAGSKVVCTGTPEALWIDVYKPIDRYVRLEVARAASTAVGEIYAFRYKGRILPEGNATAGKLTGKLLISPAEGTA